jgi:hypothetical protein
MAAATETKRFHNSGQRRFGGVRADEAAAASGADGATDARVRKSAVPMSVIPLHATDDMLRRRGWGDCSRVLEIGQQGPAVKAPRR